MPPSPPMPFETSVVAAAPAGYETPLLAIALPRGPLPPSLAGLDKQTGGAIGRVLASGDFTAKKDETVVMYPPGTAPRVLLVGLGKPNEVDRSVIRRAAAVAAKRARALGVRRGAFHLSAEARGKVSHADAGQAIAEGLNQGAWQYNEMKKPGEDKKPPLERFDLLAHDGAADLIEGHRRGEAIGAGQTFARGLQVLPGNVATPSYVAEVARDLAQRHGFGITILDKAAIIQEKMGALMSVAQGSAEEPRFIAIEYKGTDTAPIVLIGKGVTFDTGGISIKPAQNMEDMKYDMSGAAAVLGTFEMLGRLKPKVHVVGLIPSTENMPSGTAVKPGDVVTSHLGKTIEIINTDAEGRLILADALSYARRYQPAAVVDIATLTGAIVVALGHVASGVMGTDDALVEEIRGAGERADERVWPLPLWDDYRDLMKSDIADVKNSGGRPAGSISAGWFLREFVDGFPWAHLDIAGTAYSDRDDATRVKGPTGMGVRLFSEFVLSRNVSGERDPSLRSG
ncbi:MAG TPA: leucyl aminopeptidase [Gemmatimonadales bacterium]|nr:leucyl aminopeptidase [Gemmatimonadales bacterium]